MQENEFEKKVQDIMDDLRVIPSEPVWEYIEPRIPKSNRKRRFIAFMLLAIGIGVCSYFFYDKFSTSKNIAVVPVLKKKAGTYTTEPRIDSTPATFPGKRQQLSYSTQHINRSPVVKSKKTTDTVFKSPIKTTYEQAPDMHDSLIAGLALNEPEITSPENFPDDTTGDGLSRNNIPPAATDITINTDSGYTPAIALNKTVTGKASSISTHDGESSKSTGITTNKKKSYKLQAGINTFYGRSNLAEAFINFGKRNEYLFNDGSSFNSGGQDSIAVLRAASNMQPGQAWSIGFSLRKSFSKRSSITTGLEYTRFSSRLQTGVLKDSGAVFNYNNSSQMTTVRSFYATGENITQKNKYNLVQLPVLYNVKLVAGKKTNLSLTAGLSLSYLITSNALLYDSYNYAYYKNESLLRKTQLNTFGALSIEFILPNKSSILLGPQIQYGLTTVVKENTFNQHFASWGLRAAYYLGNK